MSDKLREYLQDPEFIKLLEKFIEYENKRYKNGDYNREGIDDLD